MFNYLKIISDKTLTFKFKAIKTNFFLVFPTKYKIDSK